MGVEGTYLEGIIAWHRKRAREDSRSRTEMRKEAMAISSKTSFAQAILCDEGVSLIAECKRRSPSKGNLATIADPVSLGTSYEKAGASAISVLTDNEYFSGSLNDLAGISSVVAIPCLRKDFTVDEIDLYEARIAGASAVLLIVAALDPSELKDFIDLSSELGLDALVEVHSAPELDQALDANAKIIGVNQRNLHDFTIDLNLAGRLRPFIPNGVISIVESGIHELSQIDALLDLEFDSMLVGEALVRSDDPFEKARTFVEASRREGYRCS